MATQCEKILRHLKDYGSITSLEAMQEYGIMRLASRINDLRQGGVESGWCRWLIWNISP